MHGKNPHTPILKLYREWSAELAAVEAQSAVLDDDAFYAAGDRRRAIEAQMLAMQPESPVDALAKIAAYTFRFEALSDGSAHMDRILTEIVTLVDKAAA